MSFKSGNVILIAVLEIAKKEDLEKFCPFMTRIGAPFTMWVDYHLQISVHHIFDDRNTLR